MVDGRIYRALLVVVAFAVIVFGFSLQDRPAPLASTPGAAPAMTGVGQSIATLATRFPDRLPGSRADERAAAYVGSQLAGNGFRVSVDRFSAQTALGTRTLENVYALRPGIGSGEVVVVAGRDSPGTNPGGDPGGAAATATLIGLARALSGESLDRSVLLVSTSGQVGAAGTTRLAHTLPHTGVEAVLVLSDLGRARLHGAAVLTFSGSAARTPPALSASLSAALRSAAGIRSPAVGLGGQLARLALPFALTQQAPLIAAGFPAVGLSTAGDLPPTGAQAAPSGALLAGLDAAVLQSVDALDRAAPLPAPSSFLTIAGRLVPSWAVRLLVLALILPVAASAIDAAARVRRRGHALTRWLGWALANAVPFVVGLIVLALAAATGALTAVPPGALGRSAVALTGADAAALVVVGGAIIASYLLLRPVCLRAVSAITAGQGTDGRIPQTPAADAAAVALTLVLVVLALILWVVNPFAALLLIPALHLWLWLGEQHVRGRRGVALTLALLGLAPPVIVLAYYANAYGLTPPQLVWSGVLMVAGGSISALGALFWTLTLGAASGALLLAARSPRAATAPVVQPRGVRGGLGYAGPGSLGGTESALRR